MNTSLPFVHTARRSYRLDELVSKSEVTLVRSLSVSSVLETLQTRLSRGRRSRNKVSVGEPAEGSFQQQSTTKLSCSVFAEFYSANLVVCSLLRWSGDALPHGCAPRLVFFFSSFSHQTFGLGYQRDECKRIKHNTPFNDGPLGSRNDEERGKMRKCSMNCRI